MALHPEISKRLRDEVIETHGINNIPTYESLRGLKYSMYGIRINADVISYTHPLVRAVLNETLRLFPPVPLNVRESRLASFALPVSRLASHKNAKPYIPMPGEPLLMPGSTPIMYFPMLMQRNPDLWGEDADVFDPERFLDPSRVAKLTANPMMFTPFSAGPRIVRIWV